MLLWKKAKQDIEGDTAASLWFDSQTPNSFECFEDIDTMSTLDIRRLIAMDPKRKVTTLIQVSVY